MRTRRGWTVGLVLAFLFLLPALAQASEGSKKGLVLVGIPVAFFLFALVLLGVALFHKYTLPIAVGGMVVIMTYRFAFTDFSLPHHLWDTGLVEHIRGRTTHGEVRTLLNLLGLLLGFAILAKHFEDSKIPEKLPAILPNNWSGGLVLLTLVFFLSAFLDNIAAAMIGGTIARTVFKGKVHIGFLAAIVAASNAGGAGSVVGDTTTTMMWIEGVSALSVLHAEVGAFVALLVFGGVASLQQHQHQPIQKDPTEGVQIDWLRVLIVGMILAGTIATNILLDFPAIGVWAAILIGALIRKTGWHELPGAFKGSCFLLSLVMCASMMPVEKLPPPSWKSTLGLGFVSSVFDNIPLTKLAIQQGKQGLLYDWGFLAYAVGFGGSMIWFGSSAGVAITINFPEGRSVGRWLRHGWHVMIAYVIGFLAMLLILGWHTSPIQKKSGHAPPAVPAGNR